MKISRTEQGWRVDVPDDVADALGLREGDEVRVVRLAPEPKALTPQQRAEAMEKIRSLRGTVPADFKFDREEANARR